MNEPTIGLFRDQCGALLIPTINETISKPLLAMKPKQNLQLTQKMSSIYANSCPLMTNKAYLVKFLCYNKY